MCCIILRPLFKRLICAFDSDLGESMYKGTENSQKEKPREGS